MIFKLSFYNCENKQLVDGTFEGHAGLDFIDDIRSRLPRYNNLKSSDINLIHTSNSGRCVYMNLTEDQARECGKFKHKDYVSVGVKFQLTKHIGYDVVEYWKYTWFPLFKVLDRIDVSLELDMDLVYDDWKKAGFPDVWEKHEDIN